MTSINIDKPSIFALTLMAILALSLATGIGTPQGWITTPRGAPADGDYLGVYAAGKLAAAGEPRAAYDAKRHRATQRKLDGDPTAGFYPWAYPPTFLLAATALTLLPYYFSMLTWAVGTFAAFAAAISRISVSRRDMLLMLATPAPWLNLYIGQNGAMTAALVGLGLILLRTRPIIAGICIGLLSVKPHLGLLIPVALLAGAYYRAFAAAAVTAIVLALASIAAFGFEPWLAFRDQLSFVTSGIETARDTEKIQSVFGVARGIGLSAEHALWLQAGLAAALVALTAWLWTRRDVSFDLKAGALAAAITLASPYEFVYDLVILTVAQAFLLRFLARTNIDKVDIYALVLANGFVMMFSAAPPIPLAVFGSAIVLGAILRHVWNEIAIASPRHSTAEKSNSDRPAPALLGSGT